MSRLSKICKCLGASYSIAHRTFRDWYWEYGFDALDQVGLQKFQSNEAESCGPGDVEEEENGATESPMEVQKSGGQQDLQQKAPTEQADGSNSAKSAERRAGFVMEQSEEGTIDQEISPNQAAEIPSEPISKPRLLAANNRFDSFKRTNDRAYRTNQQRESLSEHVSSSVTKSIEAQDSLLGTTSERSLADLVCRANYFCQGNASATLNQLPGNNRKFSPT